VIYILGPLSPAKGPLAVKLGPNKMKIYKYLPLHIVIKHHYSQLSWAFNFSYWWLLLCLTRSRYRPRASVGIPDVGERFLPNIWGRGTVSPCVPRHFNHWL